VVLAVRITTEYTENTEKILNKKGEDQGARRVDVLH
jgi:hypothetical protein